MSVLKQINEKREYAKGKLRMALDAAFRAMCGLDQANFSYACGQLQRVEQYAHDARFAADLADLLRTQGTAEVRVDGRPSQQGQEESGVCDSNTPASGQ